MADALALPSHLDREVDALIQTGRYSSRHEVALHAIQRLVDHEDELVHRAELKADLDRMIQEGVDAVDAGDIVELDQAFDEIQARLQAMLDKAA